MNLIKAVIIKIQNLNPAKAYLEPSWISSVKHFFENSWRPKVANYFHKYLHSRYFTRFYLLLLDLH